MELVLQASDYEKWNSSIKRLFRTVSHSIKRFAPSFINKYRVIIKYESQFKSVFL